MSAARRRSTPSMYDVAEVAGVSHQTVSRVLNEHPSIRPATRQRVLDAIAEVGYTRNGIARALATRRSQRIGVLVDSPVEYGPNNTLRGLEEAARAADYSTTTVTIADPSELSVEDAVRHLIAQGVDALCLVAPRAASLDTMAQVAAQMPSLLIAADHGAGGLTVSVDQDAGAVLAVDHLVALGHRRIAHLAGPEDWLDGQARLAGWQRRMAEHGLAPGALVVGDWSADSGFALGLEPERLEGATAVFAGNDQMALGLLHGLQRRGIRVPEDVSVVGFDDIPDSRHYIPPLTTIRQDFHALGTQAMSLLLDELAGGDRAGAMIAPTLIVRESSAALPV